MKLRRTREVIYVNVEVNYLAVLVAGIASMVIGFLWYSKLLFARPWMRLMGHTFETMSGSQAKMAPMYFISFVLSLVMAYVLTHVIAMSENFFGYDRLMTGLTSAFWMWLGFIMPVQATDVLFGGRKMALFAINTGFQLASVLAMGIVIAVMG